MDEDSTGVIMVPNTDHVGTILTNLHMLGLPLCCFAFRGVKSPVFQRFGLRVASRLQHDIANHKIGIS